MLRVIGIGPGRPEWLPPAINEIVRECDILIGGSRALMLFPDFSGSKLSLSGDLASSVEVIRKSISDEKKVGVLVSGDPGFFSFLPMLKREFPEEKIDVYPGLSSLQFAFARGELAWQEAKFVSVHGRELTVLPKVITQPTAVLTGGVNSPQRIAQFYLERDYNPKISMGNALAYPEEIWQTTDAKHLASETTLLQNAIVILHPTQKKEVKRGSSYSIGIPDDEFLRGKVPMTKAEIRVQVLAKAQISSCDNVVDVGAGTGSISIEAASLAFDGMVYAIEHNPEAQQLILENQKKFDVPNLRLIPGAAPDVFGELPSVDVCIIGGSNGRIKDILEQVPLVDEGRVVITAVTLETVSEGMKLLQELNFKEIEVVSIQAVRWKAVQHLHMAQALNPIFIISAQKEGK